MIPMPTNKASARWKISARDQQVLEHASRYRLTTIDALQRAVLPGLSRNAVGKIARRLCALGLLDKYTLLHPTRYFVLGGAGAKSLGIGSHRTAPLGPQSLPIEFAILVHAVLGKQPRMRLTKSEVLRTIAWLPSRLADAPHCLDQQHGVLELVRVDLGGSSDHVARKAALDLARRRRLREFTPLVNQGRFRLVLVTATSDKAKAVRSALERHDWPSGFKLHFSIVSQLLSLTVRQHHA